MSINANICRFCLNSEEEFIDVFDNIGVEKNLPNIINTIFQSEIEFFENNPADAKICYVCRETLCDFYEFYQSVLRNQAQFNRHNSNVFCEVFFSTDGDSTVDQVPIKIEVETDDDAEATDTSEITSNCTEPATRQYDDESNGNTNVTEQMSPVVSDALALPAHLKSRACKYGGDEQIREFGKLTCDLCANDVFFPTFRDLQAHFMNEHQTRGYVTCCDKKIYRKDRILTHITNHINPDAFKCPICGQNSKSKGLLRNHMKQHLPNKEREFECQQCPLRFALKSQLTNHEASHLTPDEKRFICDECGKAFAMKFVLSKHLLTHNKTKEFVCDLCSKCFSTNAGLQAHYAVHSVETRPRVQCKLCNSWYKNAETLRSHLQRHRDDRKRRCEHCDREFANNTSLTAHIRYVHLKVAEHECTICEKKFRRRQELIEHTARHTGEVLYRCPDCPKTFATNSNYVSHRRYRHSDKTSTQSSEIDFEK